MWPDLQASFPDVEVIQRGFGGSELSDVVYFAPRIVLPYRPRTVVLYAGDNDLAAGKTPVAVLHDFKEFVKLVHRDLPETRIVYISIKPSPTRWALDNKMRETNSLVSSYIATDPRLSYVDVFAPMIGSDGRPRPELFLEDSLHMGAVGYALWRSRLAPVIR